MSSGVRPWHRTVDDVRDGVWVCCIVVAKVAHLLKHDDVGRRVVDLDWVCESYACHVRLDNCGLLCV